MKELAAVNGFRDENDETNAEVDMNGALREALSPLLLLWLVVLAPMLLPGLVFAPPLELALAWLVPPGHDC